MATDTKKVIYDVEIKTDKAVNSTDKLSKSQGMLGGSFTKIGKSAKGFWAILKANPILTIVGLITGMVKLMTKVVEPFQPLLDWISDKMAMLKGAITGFFNSIARVGDIVKLVFQGKFKEASEATKNLTADIGDLAIATENLNKVTREQDRIQKENNLTTAESMVRQKELEVILRNTTKTSNERNKALIELRSLRKGQAQDDINEKKARLDASNQEINAKLKAKGIDIDIAKVESDLLYDKFNELGLTDAIYNQLINSRIAYAKVNEASANIDVLLVRYQSQIERSLANERKEHHDAEMKRKKEQQAINEKDLIEHIEAKKLEVTSNKDALLEKINDELEYRNILKEANEKSNELEKARLEQEGLDRKQRMADGIAETQYYINSLGNMYQGFADIQSNLNDKEYNDSKVALEKKLKNGLISQEAYDKSLYEASVKKIKAQNKIEKVAFEVQKVNDLANIAINTAVAVMKVTAQTGVAAPLLIPTIIAGGLMSAGAVASKTFTPQELPTQQAANGIAGVLKGDRHTAASGGIQLGSITAETDEYLSITNRASTAKYEPLLNKINSVGNSIGDSDNVGDIFDYDKMAQAIQSKKVYVVSNEITDKQAQDVAIRDRTSF